MISALSHVYLRKIANYAMLITYSKCSPVCWDEKKKTLALTSGHVQRNFKIFTYFYTLLFIAFGFRTKYVLSAELNPPIPILEKMSTLMFTLHMFISFPLMWFFCIESNRQFFLDFVRINDSRDRWLEGK
jgi:hypothetical protein